MKTITTLHTDGKGHWSKEKRSVEIVDIVLRAESYDGVLHRVPEGYGELIVVFNKSWKTKKHGLIYTDNLFIQELRDFLDHNGLPGHLVHYSEQGMQGKDYVSLDADRKFVKAWNRKLKGK